MSKHLLFLLFIIRYHLPIPSVMDSKRADATHYNTLSIAK